MNLRRREGLLSWIGNGQTCAVALAIITLGISGCTIGPKYARPTAPVAPAYKELPNDWKIAQPSDAISKGTWWEVYNDPQLNSLEQQIDVSNQTLKAAEDQFIQARAAIQISRSALFPNVTGSLSVSPTGLSSNRPLGGTNNYYTEYLIPVDTSYELDVWGRVRRTIEVSRSQAQASAADLANVSLSLHAELALDYFEMRGLDAQHELLDSTVGAYQRALDLTQTRYRGGIASALDVAQADTQLQTTLAEEQDVEVQRAAFEHAIAVLIGKPPSEFTITSLPLQTPPPIIPPGLPSDLLERRPDIAATERVIQAANANVGLAKIAYYPMITLGASGGLESTALGTLVQGPSAFWSLAPQAFETIFEGGLRRGVSEQAKAAFDQSIANYRQTVLSAFQEVEDNLAALRILQQEAGTETAAVAASQRSLDLSNNLYRGGLTNYLQVITAQSIALSDQITAVSILTRRMEASVLLVKAIGGGWDVSQIPKI